MKVKTWDLIIIFISGLLLFTIGQSREIIGFESRFYVFALEMWKNGPSWFPTTYGQPYPDYPGTSTFIIYLLSKMVGGVSRCSAIFPTVIASSVTLVLTYLIGALYSRIWGIAAVLILLLTYGFVVEARTISLDQFTTVITTMCFYLLASATVTQTSFRLVWIFPLLILGFFFRGPLGLVVPAGVMSIYFLLDKNVKRFVFFGFLSALLLALCTSFLLVIAKKIGGETLLQAVMQKEVFGRLQEDAKTLPYYFYWIESFGAYAIAYPLAIFVLLGTLSNLNYSNATQFLKKILGWALVVLIGLSFPADKKIRYILPAAPALALIGGYLFIVAREKHYLFFIKKLFLTICFLLPLVGVVALTLFHHKHPEFSFSYVAVLISLSVLFMLMLVVYRREMFVLVTAVLSFFVMLIFVIEPINVELNQSKTFVAQVETLRGDKKAELAFYHQGRDGLVIKYLANLREPANPVFIKTEADLRKIKKGMVVVSSEEYFQQLSKKTLKKFSIMLQGRLGREPMVVLIKK